MDGLQAVRHIMIESPVPIVVLSSLFSDGSITFDAVVCVAVFSRFDEQQIMSILNEFARITRQGGRILFSHRTDLLESSDIIEKIQELQLFSLRFSSEPYKYIPGDEHYRDVFVKYFVLQVN
ncbi:MAG: methyltransferase domain-containing protein [Candidatus Electrothrix sp. AS4_5]|nr:methyltransferase domain-containing protein [Candidatus Electrothrix gigas]